MCQLTELQICQIIRSDTLVNLSCSLLVQHTFVKMRQNIRWVKTKGWTSHTIITSKQSGHLPLHYLHYSIWSQLPLQVSSLITPCKNQNGTWKYHLGQGKTSMYKPAIFRFQPFSFPGSIKSRNIQLPTIPPKKKAQTKKTHPGIFYGMFGLMGCLELPSWELIYPIQKSLLSQWFSFSQGGTC